MSELRSIVDGLRAETLAELPDARIEEDFAELQEAMEQLEVERLRRLAEIDRRRLFERDGHLSAASWLSSRFRAAWGVARGDVKVARGLDAMPRTRAALERGSISLSAAKVLVAAREEDPEAFRRAEEHLVEAATIHSMHDLRRIAAYWRQQAEREAAIEGDEALHRRRRLHASLSFLGMVRVDGDLDRETGETLLTALQAALDAEARSGAHDDRTPAQRRADALGEICRQWLDRSDRPTVAGERPHVTLTVDAASLTVEGSQIEEPTSRGARMPTGELGRGGPVDASVVPTSGLDHAGPVDPSTVRRIACDASVMRVVLSGRSEPLDVGRRTSVISQAMRRAVIVRDRHCRFPGCDRPHAWCDAHHVVHWADGGPTAVRNLVLLCRRHHRKVHERGGFRLELLDGRPVFRRPDGSLLEDRAPP
jgi:hypothetical protein